jgi:carbohydrate kinase, thermoresistant glucokinase family
MIQRLAPSNIHATTYLIVVMGVSGSGKSTLAHSLADYYGYCYLDGDDFHSESSRARMASGQPLTDEMRAPWVASICQHLQERARRHQHCLLAFSGLRKAHRNQLREAGLKTIFLFLRGDKATIQDRLNRRTGHFMPPHLLDSQLAALEDPSGEADVVPLDLCAPLPTLLEQAIQVVNEQYELEELTAK